jgi:hypothetical protein
MASLSTGRHRFSARYDYFEVKDEDVLLTEDPNQESGHAWTLAYALRTGERHRVAVEWLNVDSERPVRGTLGLPIRAEESLVQASFRVRF